MISWKVMFFKREKSKRENFMFPRCFGEKIASLSSHWNPPIYTKEKGSNFPKCDLLSQVYTEHMTILFCSLSC